MLESIINTEEQKDKIINQDLNTSEKKVPKKIKKKKKAKKKKPEKECKNLKELLDEIKQEKDQKLLKEKKLKEKKKSKEENQLKENLNFINRSISYTTTGASSLDDFNLPNYLLINNNDISENDPSEESFNKNRKMSSPIFDYYNGYDKFLSNEEELSIDLTNSANFVEKNKFISSCELNSNHININPNINEVGKNYFENNYNTNEIINNESINYNNNSSMMYNKENDYLNYYDYTYNYIPDSKFNMTEGSNDIQNIIKNINNNYASFYSNMYIKEKNYDKKYVKKSKNKFLSKSNTIRLGDWTCLYCYNLNFSFRKSCNRCNAPKPIL